MYIKELKKKENYFLALKVHRAFDSSGFTSSGKSNGIEKTLNSSFSKVQTLQHQWIFIPLHSAFIQQQNFNKLTKITNQNQTQNSFSDI